MHLPFIIIPAAIIASKPPRLPNLLPRRPVKVDRASSSDVASNKLHLRLKDCSKLPILAIKYPSKRLSASFGKVRAISV